MSSVRVDRFFARIDAAELGLCSRVHRAGTHHAVRRAFLAASRLGDGIAWYVLLALLPLLYGAAGLRAALAMAATGLVGLLVYRSLKHVFVRERPFVTHATIAARAAPLDRYSFPSGHTLHAVLFTSQGVCHFPELAWVLVPLCALIAGSRVLLGLHYPSDVLVGAGLGAALAAAGLRIF